MKLKILKGSFENVAIAGFSQGWGSGSGSGYDGYGYGDSGYGDGYGSFGYGCGYGRFGYGRFAYGYGADQENGFVCLES